MPAPSSYLRSHPDWAKPGMTVTIERHHPILGLEHSRTAVVERQTAKTVFVDGHQFREISLGRYAERRSRDQIGTYVMRPAVQPAPEPKEERESGEIQVSPSGYYREPHQIVLQRSGVTQVLRLTTQEANDLLDHLTDHLKES